jgi:predicted porin
MEKRGFSLATVVLAALAALGAPAQAQEADAKLKLSGFLSIVGGRISGTNEAQYEGPAFIDGKQCPCYIADWGNAGVYTEKFSLKPESRAGIQAKYTVSKEINFVGQLAIRGSDTTPRVQWAYASYAPSKNLEFQLGRKRIPLYFYSDFQDIGASYPWVAVPPELYGWEATNYNGASVRYKSAVGDANISLSLFTGKETVKDSLYQRLYYDSKTKVIWSKLIGGDVELTRGPLTVRAVYMQTTVRSVNPTEELDDTARLKAYGVAANLDLEDWFVLAEVTQLTRDFDAGYRVTAPAATIGAGYHLGDWTPFVNYARYIERTNDLDIYAPQSYKRASVTLRYDLDARSAIKGQIDRQKDVTRNFGGDSTVVRLAYDRLF